MQLYVTFIDPGCGWTSGLLTWLPARTWPKYAWRLSRGPIIRTWLPPRRPWESSQVSMVFATRLHSEAFPPIFPDCFTSSAAQYGHQSSWKKDKKKILDWSSHIFWPEKIRARSNSSRTPVKTVPGLWLDAPSAIHQPSLQVFLLVDECLLCQLWLTGLSRTKIWRACCIATAYARTIVAKPSSNGKVAHMARWPQVKQLTFLILHIPDWFACDSSNKKLSIHKVIASGKDHLDQGGRTDPGGTSFPNSLCPAHGVLRQYQGDPDHRTGSAAFARTPPNAALLLEDLQQPDSLCPAHGVLQQCQGDPDHHTGSAAFARTPPNAALLLEDLQQLHSFRPAHAVLRQYQGDPDHRAGSAAFARTPPNAALLPEDLQQLDLLCPAHAVLRQCQGDPDHRAGSASFARTPPNAALLPEDLQQRDSHGPDRWVLRQCQGNPDHRAGSAASARTPPNAALLLGDLQQLDSLRPAPEGLRQCQGDPDHRAGSAAFARTPPNAALLPEDLQQLDLLCPVHAVLRQYQVDPDHRAGSASLARTPPNAALLPEDLQQLDSLRPAHAVLRQCQGDPDHRAGSASVARTPPNAALLLEYLQQRDSLRPLHAVLRQCHCDVCFRVRSAAPAVVVPVSAIRLSIWLSSPLPQSSPQGLKPLGALVSMIHLWYLARAGLDDEAGLWVMSLKPHRPAAKMVSTAPQLCAWRKWFVPKLTPSAAATPVLPSPVHKSEQLGTHWRCCHATDSGRTGPRRTQMHNSKITKDKFQINKTQKH